MYVGVLGHTGSRVRRERTLLFGKVAPLEVWEVLHAPQIVVEERALPHLITCTTLAQAEKR
jgi:hypothetical protein